MFFRPLAAKFVLSGELRVSQILFAKNSQSLAIVLRGIILKMLGKKIAVIQKFEYSELLLLFHASGGHRGNTEHHVRHQLLNLHTESPYRTYEKPDFNKF